jgi:hypothetical protein
MTLEQLGKDGVKNYKPMWRQIYVLFGDSMFSQMSSSTHVTDISRLLDASEYSFVRIDTVAEFVNNLQILVL